mmetsp:Transcript_15677/g.37119  ORF Transcript_15677/g.37119 Transcript_15677/m.37119 type:complete len:204 (-) Transcript_15677:1819-2430(-)
MSGTSSPSCITQSAATPRPRRPGAVSAGAAASGVAADARAGRACWERSCRASSLVCSSLCTAACAAGICGGAVCSRAARSSACASACSAGVVSVVCSRSVSSASLSPFAALRSSQACAASGFHRYEWMACGGSVMDGTPMPACASCSANSMGFSPVLRATREMEPSGAWKATASNSVLRVTRGCRHSPLCVRVAKLEGKPPPS